MYIPCFASMMPWTPSTLLSFSRFSTWWLAIGRFQWQSQIKTRLLSSLLMNYTSSMWCHLDFVMPCNSWTHDWFVFSMNEVANMSLLGEWHIVFSQIFNSWDEFLGLHSYFSRWFASELKKKKRHFAAQRFKVLGHLQAQYGVRSDHKKV